MPTGIYQHKPCSEETKTKISLVKKGHLVSSETRKKISDRQKGNNNSPKTNFKKGNIPWNKGLSWNNETREKISFSKKLNPTRYWLGKKRNNMQADKNPNWKGGISKLLGYKSHIQQLREFRKKGNGGSHSYQEWLDLKEKYNNTCPSCLRKEPEIKLTKDHIIAVSLGGSGNINNIQPLCISCNSQKQIREINYLKGHVIWKN